MNKRLYRLVFNRALGLLQVTSELVSAATGGSRGNRQSGARPGTSHAITLAVALALSTSAATPPALAQHAAAQPPGAEATGRITSDPNAPGSQRPTVIAAPNGTPLVNITTPSGAGVSRNTYTQLDVGTQGVILNNARGTVQTQLGGWVQGNPWLATGTARVILNEVNSHDPSQLRGYVEVGGDRAEVVIANPAGIQVDGSGFINASRATLTTGTPVLGAGSLDHYRVSGGAITVSGGGLDASRTDYTRLISRSLQLNAAIWAQDLTTTLGARTADAETGVAGEQVAATMPAPAYALDVSQLGGMYAGKITLVGTEHGVGVRNAGTLAAQAGNLVVTVDGRLENTGLLQSRQDSEISARGGVANSGLISAGRTLSLHTGADVDNRGGTLNAMRVVLGAQSLQNRNGAIEQTGVQALALHAGTLSNRDRGMIGEIASGPGHAPGLSIGDAPAGNGEATSGAAGGSGTGNADGSDTPATFVPMADGTLRVTDLLANDGGRISAGGGIALSSERGLDNAGGQLGLRALAIRHGDLLNEAGALTVAGHASLQVGVFDNDAGTFTANTSLDLHAGTLSNRAGRLLHVGTHDTRLQVTDVLDNTDGLLASNAGRLEIFAGHFVNTYGTLQHVGARGLNLAATRLDGDAGSIFTGGTLALTAADITHRGATLSAHRFDIGARQLDNTSGRIIATGTEGNQLRIGDGFDNTGGVLATNGDLSLAAASMVNTQGTVQHAGDGTLSLDVERLDGHGGTLSSNGALVIAGESIDLRDGTTAARSVRVETGDLITAGGQLMASGAGLLSLQVRGALDNRAGSIGGNGAIELHAAIFDNSAGRLQAGGATTSVLHVTGTLDNRAGMLLIGGDSRIHAGSLFNQRGTEQTAGAASQLDVDGVLDNSEGTLSSHGDMGIRARTLQNRAGTLAAGGALDAAVASGIDNTSGVMQAAGRLALAADGLINTTGTAVGADVLIDTRAHALDNTGGVLVSTTGDLAVRSGAFDNTAGTVQSAGALDIDTAGQVLTNRESGDGGLRSTGMMTLHTGDLDNQSGMAFALGGLHVQAGAIDNTVGGQLATAGDLVMQATALANAGGRVQAGGDGRIDLSGRLDNHDGLIAATDALQIAAADIDNQGTLSSALPDATGLQAGTLLLSTRNLDNREGRILAGDSGTLQLTGQFDNGGGQVASNGDLHVSADTVTNSGGTLLSAGDQTVTARQLGGDGRILSQGDATLTLQDSFHNTGEVTVRGTLSLDTVGDLRNAGTLQAGNLELLATHVDNTVDGTITAQGLAHVVARDTLRNRGRIDAAITHLEAAQVDNVGTGHIYGDHVAIQSGRLDNRDEGIGGVVRSATIAARERLDLGVTRLANTGGSLIYSDGGAAIGGLLDSDRLAAGTAVSVDNIGSTIEASGDLAIQSQAVNNIRQDIAVSQATAVLHPVRLDQPTWRHNGRNGTSDYRSSSNYDAYEVYYLHPDDILEDTPYITPDGFTVHRAVVRLTPQTSAYLFGRGAMYGALAERSRLPATDGTATLYYLGRQDGQANPDQVLANADDPFVELSTAEPGAPSLTYRDDDLTYSSAYGTCTDNCVQLWAPLDYDDPDHTLIHPRGTGGGGLGDNEQVRVATHTITEDRLEPGAGQIAVIQSGGAMHITTDALLNQYGRIASGGDMRIDGLTAPPIVTNPGLTLYRTHAFDNVTHAYNGTTRAWSNPSISEVIAHVGGAITSNGTLTVEASDLSNFNEGRDAPNVQSSSRLGNLSLHDSGPGVVAPLVPDGLSGMLVADRAVGVASADGSSDTVVAAALRATLPTGSLFNVRPNGGTYLVETDPAFADYRQWLGSDYLLSSLGLDPGSLHKRLGDGYYEQKLVREQIGQLTGRRFLDGHRDDEDQFRALMEAGALFARAFGLRPGIALSAEQMAQLTSDIVWLVEQTVTLPDGTTTTALVPQVYLRLRPGDLHDDGALLGAERVDLKLSGNLLNTGTIAGRQLTSISAATIDNLAGGQILGQVVALQSEHDINNIGGTVKATDVLDVRAQGNIIVASTTQTQQGTGYSTTQVDRVAGLYVTNPDGRGLLSVHADGRMDLAGAEIRNAGKEGFTHLSADGGLTLSTLTTGSSTDLTGPGNNFHRTSETRHVGTTVQGEGKVLLEGSSIDLTNAQLNAGDALMLRSDGDITSHAVVDSVSVDSSVSGRRHSRAVSATDETVRGSTFTAVGLISMEADDITLQSAAATSQAGDIALLARGDIALTSTSETHSLQVDETTKKSGLVSSKTITTHDKVVDTYAIGTTLSGERVRMISEGGITTQAAQVVGTGDVLMAAKGDIVIGTGVNTHTEEHGRSVKQSGLFSGGGAGFTIGSRRTDTTADILETTHTGSLIGSLEGRVDVVGLGNVHITGSEVISREGIGIQGRNVLIDAAEDVLHVNETQTFKQQGINVSVKGGAVDTVLAVANSVDRAGAAKDDRLVALHLAKAGQTLFGSGGMESLGNLGAQANQGISDANNGEQSSSDNGLSLRIGIGASSSSSSMDYTATTARGSRISSTGHTVIQAVGDGQGNEGDLTIIGSQVDGEHVTLTALNDMLLLSQRETREQIERNKASSGEIGLTLGSEAGIGIYVSLSGAKGKGDGSGTTHAETVIRSTGTTTLITGGDLIGTGAQVFGERIVGQVDGDLLLSSQQDSNDYARKDVTGGIDVAVGTGGASVSGYANLSKVDSTYTSVKEQTGFQAGSGGFDITVGGHSQLDGAAIASTADPIRNVFRTGTLGFTDLRNEAAYEASSISVSGGTGGGFSGSVSHQDDRASGTSRAGISAGTLLVRDGSAVASLDRSVITLQQDGLKEIFDAQAVSERAELGQLAGEMGFQTAGDIAGRMGWEEGSKERTVLHGVVGAAMAALGGGNALDGLTGAAANQLALPLIVEALQAQGIVKGTSEFDTYMQLASLAVGAAVSGGVGAGAALTATQNNWLKHWEFEALKKADGACGQGNQSACQEAEQLRALDKSRDRDYAAYATSTLESMRADGIALTEEEFSRRMDGYWSANRSDRRDVVYPEGGFIPTYPTHGQELYGFLGRLAENLPDWYAGKAPAEFSTTLMQGLLEQGGEAVAGWMDLFSPDTAINWFTGESVTGVDAWEARFGSGAELMAGWLTGGGNNVVRAGVDGVGNAADNALNNAAQAAFRDSQGVYSVDGKPLMNFSLLSNAQKMVVGDILGESKILHLVPDGKLIGRFQGVGETGIDNILQVNRPDVDYVIVEYKFDRSRLKPTTDGMQGSDAWSVGAVSGDNRILKAVEDDELARDIRDSLDAGRIERWVVNTDRYGNVAIGMLDKNGKFIAQPRSRLFGGAGP